MAATKISQSRRSFKRKLMRQKQCRRKSSLMKKACEYSRLCEADVCLGIRIRETGQVFILLADSSELWGFLGAHLNSYYPVPCLRTEREPETTEKLLVSHQSDETTLEE
ncbi:unnamed protein product [Penicillium salamii]|nr:unnamed protein product [Penicillium salamii]CAG8286701.1 unnamed protein product [Penicillium salamii]